MQNAWVAGHEKDAFQFLYALALTDDKADVLSKYQWVTGLKRPALGVRWGIGVVLSPANFPKDVYPIGTEQNIPENPRAGTNRRGRSPSSGSPYGSRRGSSGGSPPGYRGGSRPGAPSGLGAAGGGGPGGSESLQKLAGELGQSLAQGLQERIARGDYGEVLKDAVAIDRRGAGGDVYGRGRGPQAGAPAQPAAGAAGGPGAGGANMNAPAPPPPSVGGGNGPPPGAPAAGGSSGARFHRGGGAGGAAGSAESEGAHVALSAGVTFLGLSSHRQLVEQAEDDGLDVLVEFDVSVKENRVGIVNNETRVVVHDLKKGSQSEIYRSKELNNVEVQKKRKDTEDKSPDPVEEFMAKLFEAIDGDAGVGTMKELPAGIQPEHVINRIKDLVTGDHPNPLPILAEIKFYHSRGLLTDELQTQAFQKLLGELPGAKLAQGTKAERMEVIKRWLPKPAEASP